MRRATIVCGALVACGLVFALFLRDPATKRNAEPAAATSPAMAPSIPADARPAAEVAGFLYGRITDVDGATYEGRLRWGHDQETFWSDYFDGAKKQNRWAAHVPADRASKERTRIEIFGLKIGGGDSSELRRLFLARFGDIARVDAHFSDVQVTLKSGTVFELDRFAAGDIDDGVRVWDGRRGIVDLDARRIRTIEFLPTAPLAGAPDRLHGTVRTQQGDFTGFIEWDEQDGVSTDELAGRTAGGKLSLRYDTIRSIARASRDSALVTLVDGREMVLSDSRETGHGNHGIYVDDRRYGRVLLSWDAFARLDFTPGGAGLAYADFPAGQPLAGSVTTHDGRRLAGRLVYDFDESETTETFDAPSQGVDYHIPFGLITSIVPPGRDGNGAQRGKVILHDGEVLQLDRTGDFGDKNAGILIFVDGRESPEYVSWTDVERIDLERVPRF